MSKEIHWLWKESKRWEQEGLITGQQAEQIRHLYPEPSAPLPWSMIIFSGLGAVIGGLGVILLLAYNWQSLHKFAKLGIILAGVAGLHTGGLRLYLGSQRWRQLGEALCLLGTMLFGAGIWLVAQIYHIEEHFPNGFLIWGLGALALAWAMPSLAQALLAVFVLCIWGCSEAWGFNHAIHWGPVMLLVATGLLAWRLRSRVLLIATLSAFAFLICATVSAVDGDLILRVALNCSLAFVAIAFMARRKAWFPEAAGIWSFVGWFGFLFCVYLLTFPEIAGDLLGWDYHRDVERTLTTILYEWVPLAICLALWATVLCPRRSDAGSGACKQTFPLETWLLPLTSIVCQLFALASFVESKWAIAGVFNLVFLAVAGAWMARGCREGALRSLVLGAGLLVCLTVSRYFDLFESLAMRGLVFLLVGALFFVEGALFRRTARRLSRGNV
jgi:uncharacterized membrane protein